MANRSAALKRSSLKAKTAAPYFFIAPYFILYFLLGLYPIIYSFYISLTNWNGLNKVSLIGYFITNRRQND